MPKLSNDRLSAGGPRETKDKKNIVEVFPAKKMAKIKGNSLCLSGPDGSQATIELLNCTVLAVSASSMPSRKWLVLALNTIHQLLVNHYLLCQHDKFIEFDRAFLVTR